jgi:DNA topoisomerase-2
MATVEKYRRTDDISHVLLRPDAYVGSKAVKSTNEYLFTEDGRLERKTIAKSPALERTFIEIISNAVDNALRHGNTKSIKITVSKGGLCSVWNDGNVIPVVKNETEDMYNHTLIFGHLRSSSNYDDSQKRFVSGRNGFGAKLTNVFSKVFQVEGVDPSTGKKLVQRWERNMRDTKGPKVTPCTVKTGYTAIKWWIDFSQFNEITEYSDEMIDLFRSHALDAAVNTRANVRFNGVKMPNSLQKYASLIIGEPLTPGNFIKLESQTSEALVFSGEDGEFEQVSFVNGIRTKNGGKHVDAWVEAVCRPVLKKLDSQSKGSISLRDVKRRLKFIVVASVPNPEFESQEKACLESPGISVPSITDSHVTKILTKWGVRVALKDQMDSKEKVKAAKTISSKKGAVIPGYDKANFSGRSKDCVLIICEGLSAKTFAVEGMAYGLCGKKGRDWIGIYPLRGKILNARKASPQTIAANEVITNLITILGLDFSKPAKLDSLKYGKICIITDADTDGTHIKALLLNWVDSCFPKLMDRVVCMNTPIVRVGKKYYYDERTEITTKGESKYFKGLGTTEKKDIGAIFGRKMTNFVITGQKSKDSLEMAFGKGSAEDRKDWVGRFKPGVKSDKTIDHSDAQWNDQPVEDFIENDLVQFAHDDCVRSIPSVFDGLKESQRKILYAAKKEKFTKEMKITQFAGYVSKNTEYHHGEQNLLTTTIKMAQDFVGSNNFPFFTSEQMFGTRLAGGKDASQARYLHTKLLPITNSMFPTADDKLLKIQYDGKMPIEPKYYVPVVPTILLNGCKGIGTGWCCDIPCFSLSDVADNVKRWMNKLDIAPMTPRYNGFTGDIRPVKGGKFEIKGKWERESEKKIKVRELPVGYWNDKFKEWCGNQDDIVDVKDYSTPLVVDMTLVVTSAFTDEKIDKELTSTVNVNNIVVFDDEGALRSITLPEVFDMWGRERKRLYKIRKDNAIEELRKKIEELTEKTLFIRLVKEGKINLFDEESNILRDAKKGGVTKHVDTVRNLPTKHFTKEMRIKLEDEAMDLKTELETLRKTSVKSIWLKEIDQLG